MSFNGNKALTTKKNEIHLEKPESSLKEKISSMLLEILNKNSYVRERLEAIQSQKYISTTESSNLEKIFLEVKANLGSCQSLITK